MRDTLKFVRGAVAERDYVPVLTHFRISNGRIQGGNGKIAIDAPIDLDYDITVPADKMVKAIDACGDTHKMKLTDKGRLSITSGRFRTVLPLGDLNAYPLVQPEGEKQALPGEMLPTLKLLEPFIATDATRPWACGIFFKGRLAFATNNIILVQAPSLFDAGEQGIVLPVYAVKEMLRIGEEPIAVSVAQNSATFFYEGDKWLRTNLLDNDWPEAEGMLDQAHAEASLAAMPEDLLDAVQRVLPFCPDQSFRVVRFEDGHIRTLDGDYSAEFEGFDLPEASFVGDMLLRVLGIAGDLDLGAWPAPVPFANRETGVRGIIVGVR